MDESLRQLRQEGDVNFSEGREEWYSQLNPETLEWLSRDTAVFLHQSLSTPCLNVIESCEGIYLMDINGKRYMDFHGNSVHQVGYKNPYVTERLKEQLDLLPFSPRRYTNKIAIQLAEKLVSLLPASLSRVLFAPGGTSAVGMALKMARRITGKHKVVSIQGSFHGASSMPSPWVGKNSSGNIWASYSRRPSLYRRQMRTGMGKTRSYSLPSCWMKY